MLLSWTPAGTKWFPITSRITAVQSHERGKREILRNPAEKSFENSRIGWLWRNLKGTRFTGCGRTLLCVRARLQLKPCPFKAAPRRSRVIDLRRHPLAFFEDFLSDFRTSSTAAPCDGAGRDGGNAPTDAERRPLESCPSRCEDGPGVAPQLGSGFWLRCGRRPGR